MKLPFVSGSFQCRVGKNPGAALIGALFTLAACGSGGGSMGFDDESRSARLELTPGSGGGSMGFDDEFRGDLGRTTCVYVDNTGCLETANFMLSGAELTVEGQTITLDPGSQVGDQQNGQHYATYSDDGGIHVRQITKANFVDEIDSFSVVTWGTWVVDSNDDTRLRLGNSYGAFLAVDSDAGRPALDDVPVLGSARWDGYFAGYTTLPNYEEVVDTVGGEVFEINRPGQEGYSFEVPVREVLETRGGEVLQIEGRAGIEIGFQHNGGVVVVTLDDITGRELAFDSGSSPGLDSESYSDVIVMEGRLGGNQFFADASGISMNTPPPDSCSEPGRTSSDCLFGSGDATDGKMSGLFYGLNDAGGVFWFDSVSGARVTGAFGGRIDNEGCPVEHIGHLRGC